jgi:CBS-domain-containing membrane protein
MNFNLITIFTSEEARWQGKPLHEALLNYMQGLKLASRCLVTRGIAGCYENGEMATTRLEILSFKMPLKIEIILPAPEMEGVLPTIRAMVTDGIVCLSEMTVLSFRTQRQLLPGHLRVRDVMTPAPQKVTPATSLRAVTERLLSSVFTGMPVVDEKDRPLGIITQGDLIYRAGLPVRLGLLAETDQEKARTLLEALASRKAEEIMSRPAMVIPEDELAVEAVNLMLEKKLKRLPVVDQQGKLVGIVSRVDIFRIIMRKSPDWGAFQAQRIDVQNLQRVSDIMRRETITVAPSTPIEEVLEVINSGDIQRVAVVDPEGIFLGLISDRDLFTLFSDHKSGLWDFFVQKIHLVQPSPLKKEGQDHLKTKTAADVMRTDLITVREDTTLDEALKLMTEKALKRLPVIDVQGKFKGLISRDSLLRTGFAKAGTSARAGGH